MFHFRHAVAGDIPSVAELQQRYHVGSIAEEDKKDGFVTTLFREEQFRKLIEEENGLAVALHHSEIIGYAMAASWEFWSAWPLFQQMIGDLPGQSFHGVALSVGNSYQYGPVCLDKAWRGQGVLERLFAYSLESMAERYPVMITFINQINPRSLAAHERKLGMEVIRSFEFNNNHYYELGIFTH